ncbi:MAG: hypothetical protein IPP71_11930 [Bacteroidetes bacterium]|nr:hypothetical protein [Bacteroidota bacterium]
MSEEYVLFLMQRYQIVYSTYIPEPGKTFNLTTMATQLPILSRKEKRRIAIFTNSTLHHTQLLKKTILFLIYFVVVLYKFTARRPPMPPLPSKMERACSLSHWLIPIAPK